MLFVWVGILNLASHTVSGRPVFTDSLPSTGYLNQKDSSHSPIFKPATLILPAAFIVYGTLRPVIGTIEATDDTLYNRVLRNHAAFHTNAEEYLMWAPSAAVYLMDAFKIKTRHSFKEHILLDAGSIILTGGIGFGMRLLTGSIKEYNTNKTEFPSGHAANAFRGAEMFHQELKDRNAVLSYSGYVVATAVGVLRIYNKDHYISQVIAGAGLGILSTKLTYWIFGKVTRHVHHP